MSGVLTKPVARQDVLVRRGVSSRWGVRWLQDSGYGFVPVNLLAWSGVARLSSRSGDVWLEIPVTLTIDGHAIVDLAPGALTGEVWAGRKIGVWSLTVTSPDGVVERLGEGFLRVED